VSELSRFAGVELQVCELGTESTRAAVFLASAPNKKVVRLTGGAGGMAASQANEMYDMFVSAFKGCEVALIAGGTRMLAAPGYTQVKPSITEVLPKIIACSPKARAIGVVPRIDNMVLHNGNLVIYREPEHINIIHPKLHSCIILQYADRGLKDLWTKEWQASLEYMELLRDSGGYEPLHIVYNGGMYTEQELLHVAKLTKRKQARLLLIEGSGRMASKYAADKAFRSQYNDQTEVLSCKPHELAQVLRELKIVQQ